MAQATRLAVILLVVGLVVGIGIGWVIKPVPPELSELQAQVSDLESKVREKEDEISRLQKLNEQLKLDKEKLEAILGEVPPDGIIRIKVWAMGDPASTTRVTNVEDAANILNTILTSFGLNVKIEVKGEFTVGGGAEVPDLIRRYTAAFEAGEAPDIIGWKVGDLVPLIEQGMILELDDFIKKYDSLLGDVYETLWDSVKFKGKFFGLPQDTEARPLYFRKDVLRKLGWSEAEIDALPDLIRDGKFTIVDMIKVGKEAMDRGLVKWGFIHRPTFGAEFPFVMLYFQYGGKLQDPETLKLILDKGAMLRSFQLIHRLAQVDKVLPPTMVGTSWRDVHATFVNAEALFWFGGTWHWAEYQVKEYHRELGKLPEDYLWENVGFALSPAPEAGFSPLTISSPNHYLISSQSKFPELAFLLALIATLPPLDAKHAVDSGHLAVRSTTVGYPYYSQARFLAEVSYLLEFTTFEPVHPKYAAYKSAWLDAVASVETGAKTPDQALNDLESRLRAEIGDELIVRG